MVDKLENDYSRTCTNGEKLIAEPGRPQISAAKRYIIGIGNRLIYSKVMQKRDKSKIYVLGIGEVAIPLRRICNLPTLSISIYNAQ